MKSKARQTRFPVARIKKIMQKDDDVGKVAQATPVLISKALEIFMQKLVDEASKEAQGRGSKKVSAHHLKRTIEHVDKFDFLKDLVAGVPDPGDKAEKGGEDGEGGEPKKKRGRGKGKKKLKAEEEAVAGEEDMDDDE